MQAGKLRQRIKIYTVPAPQSSTGAEIPVSGDARTLICEAWAEVKRSVRLPEGSGQGESHGGVQLSEQTHEITMRYKAGIIPTMEVDFAGRTFDILDVDDKDNRHRELILIAWEHLTSATP